MAKKLSSHLEVPIVHEYARTYLESNGPTYDLSDLKRIEEGQQNSEKAYWNSDFDTVIHDTDFLTLWIWYSYKYNIFPDRVYNYLQRHLPDLYLLCYPDIPWEQDELRENPNDGLELYRLYKAEIEKLGVPFEEIKGSHNSRTRLCISAIEKILT